MCWQKYRECTADTNFALRIHVPTVAIYNMFDDGEAEPSPLFAGGHIGLGEPIAVLFGQADAIILDLEHHLVVLHQ